MKQIVLTIAAASVLVTAVPAFADANASVQMNPGRMLYAANGQRIASIYRVDQNGNPQIVLNGKLITVPASTLSNVNGKVTTSLTKAEVSQEK